MTKFKKGIRIQSDYDIFYCSDCQRKLEVDSSEDRKGLKVIITHCPKCREFYRITVNKIKY